MREYTTTETKTVKRFLFRCNRKGCKGIIARDIVIHIVEERYYDPATNQSHRFAPRKTYDGNQTVQHEHCPECGRETYGTPVKGYKTDHVCDARCTSAKGQDCECSCGGQNHGQAYL